MAKLLLCTSQVIPRSETRFCGILKDAKGRVGGPQGAAARMGMKRTTLISRMKKLGIERRSAY